MIFEKQMSQNELRLISFAEIKVLYLVNCFFALKARSFPKIIACKPFFFYHSYELSS